MNENMAEILETEMVDLAIALMKTLAAESKGSMFLNKKVVEDLAQRIADSIGESLYDYLIDAQEYTDASPSAFISLATVNFDPESAIGLQYNNGRGGEIILTKSKDGVKNEDAKGACHG